MPLVFTLMIVTAVIALVLALFLILLLMMAPGKCRSGFPFQGALIAHRGLHGDGVPERVRAASV